MLGAKFGEGFEREQKKEELAAFLEEHEQDTVQQRLKVYRRSCIAILTLNTVVSVPDLAAKVLADSGDFGRTKSKSE